MSVRWTLREPSTGATWVMPINPNQATSPRPHKKLTTAHGSKGRVGRSLNRARTFMGPPEMPAWEWGGVIRSQEQYDKLLEWSQKSNAIHVTDHLGHTFEVIFDKFTPEDRRPLPEVPVRMTYTMRALVLKEVLP